MRFAYILAVAVLCGCSAVSGPRVGFINRTTQPNSVLDEQWEIAQEQIGTKPILIDAAAVAVWKAAKPIYLPPDPRVLALEPWGITVETKHGEGSQHAINCGAGPAYSCIPDGHTVWISDWWMQNYPQTVEYEFENLLLGKLGYDLSAR